MAKFTKASFKAFLRKNEGKLFILNKSHFDGMTDSVEAVPGAHWRPLVRRASPGCEDATLGFDGIWLVSGSRNYFNAYNQDGYEGWEVWNCVGSFVVATQQITAGPLPGNYPMTRPLTEAGLPRFGLK